MMTTFRWYLLGLALLFGAYVAVEYCRPKPLDWTRSLQNDDKIPYGTYVLYDVLPSVLGLTSANVRPVRVPIYSQLEGVDEDAAPDPEPEPAAAATPDTATAHLLDSLGVVLPAAREQAAGEEPEAETDEDYTSGLADGGYQPATYLFVVNQFSPSRADTRSLLRHVARGNDVFIAAESFDAYFADTLGFQTTEAASLPLRWKRKAAADSARATSAADSVQLHLLNPALARQVGRNQFRLPSLAASTRLLISPRRAADATQLAADEASRSVLLRLPHGRGHVYLCSVPLAFSNYFVLQPRTGNFAFAALSYLPAGRPVWWDEYQKQGRRGEQSLLRVLLAHEALRTALYLSLVGALLFVLVEARRRQRIIPVLRPLPNTTLLFTRTVAGLYRQQANHALIAEKKIGLFQEFLRTRYHEPGLDLTDDATRERIAQKSGVARPDVDALVRRMNFLLTARQVSDAELLALNRAINQFRQQAA